MLIPLIVGGNFPLTPSHLRFFQSSRQGASLSLSIFGLVFLFVFFPQRVVQINDGGPIADFEMVYHLGLIVVVARRTAKFFGQESGNHLRS